MFTTLSEFRALCEAKGSQWFDRGAMRFFDTRIVSKLLRGRYFITSEQFHDRSRGYSAPRRFSLRLAMLDGKVETIGGFNSFIYKADVKEYLRELPEYLPQAVDLANQCYCKKPGDFLHHVFVEVNNYKPGDEITFSGFTGACLWLMFNYNDISSSYQYYWEEIAEKYV